MLRSILMAAAAVAITAGSTMADDRGPMQLLGTQVTAQTSNAVAQGSAEVTPVRWGYNGYRGGYGGYYGGYRPYGSYYRGGYGGYYNNYYNNYYRPYGSYYRGGYGYGYRPYYGGWGWRF